VRTQRVLKGSLESDTIVLKQPGGTVGSGGIRIFGQPVFRAGDDVLLYLNVSTDLSLQVAHCFMGMFRVLDDTASGGRIVERWDDAGEVTRLQSDRPRGDVTDRAPLDAYVEKIRDTLRRNASLIPPETEGQQADFLAIPPEFARKRHEAAPFAPQYALIGTGVRWMQADVGQPVVFTLNTSNSPIAGGGTAELTRAMNAWSAQSGANIRLQLGSSTTSCGLSSDGVNTISYADCRNQLTPGVNCGGVVATTSVAWSFETKTVSGHTFFRIIETDLIFNKGMDCFLSNPANLAEAACHELGHAIGLAHSSDSSAIMFGSIRGQGRDATLAPDDRTGVLFIYPSSGGGGGGGGGSSPVSIASIPLAAGTEGVFYHHTLTATGGTSPYSWQLISGQLPPGISFSTAGTLSGTPTRAGSYQFFVQVTDSNPVSRSTDTSPMVLTIQASSVMPVVERVKVKGEKKIFIYGDNFRADSLILLNGRQLTPKSFELEHGQGRLMWKGKLNLNRRGSNIVQIVNPDGTSPPFGF
jgi:hypothetical protein